MGSVIRVAGSIAAATVIQAGVVTTAHAAQLVNVPCSTPALISAINAANSNGWGTLRLAAYCDYVLTSAVGAGRGPSGLPIITGNIRLIGGDSTIIRRSFSAPRFRILEVSAGAALGLDRIYIAGGRTDGTIPGNDTGGGILISRGTVELYRTTVMRNTADNGAGISNDSGRLKMGRTIIRDNATNAGGGGGGGLYNDGTIKLDRVHFIGNRANTNGGAIYNGQGGRTQAYRVTFARNSARANGGGIYNASDGSVRLTRGLVVHNRATDGGGIFNAGISSRVLIFSSLIAANDPNNCAPINTLFGCSN